MSRLEEWFGPSNKWLQDIIWPIIGLPVMTIVVGFILFWVMAGSAPEP
jgi:hypothetical protein